MQRCRRAGREGPGRVRRAGLLAAFAAAVIACGPRVEGPAPVWTDELGVAESGASSVLRDIGEAREDIQRNDALEAEWDVERADRGLDVLEQFAPADEPFGRLWLARKELEYEGPVAALPDLDVLSVVVDEIESREGPLPAVREQLAEARRSIESGDRRAASQELARVADLLSTQTQGLPFASARRQLADARLALRRADLEAADTSLQGAEKAVLSFVRMVRSPLRVAHRSLYGAAASLAARNPGLAQRRLNLARSSLEALAAERDYPGRDEAAELARDLRGIEGRLAQMEDETRGRLAELADRVRELPAPPPEPGAAAGTAGSDALPRRDDSIARSVRRPTDGFAAPAGSGRSDRLGAIAVAGAPDEARRLQVQGPRLARGAGDDPGAAVDPQRLTTQEESG